jgi:hypothetical protein
VVNASTPIDAAQIMSALLFDALIAVLRETFGAVPTPFAEGFAPPARFADL